MEILEKGIFVVFSYPLGIFLIYQIKNKMHNYNIKIITIEEIIIGIIWKHCRFSVKNIFILFDFSCMSTSGEGDQKKGHFEHGRINFLSCIYWVNILRNFGIFLAELVYLFWNFGILALKNSSNPAVNHFHSLCQTHYLTT
jgi:hypothetical protein